MDVEVGVVLTDSALFDGDHTAADLVGYGPIPADLARDLLDGDEQPARRIVERLQKPREAERLEDDGAAGPLLPQREGDQHIRHGDRHGHPQVLPPSLPTPLPTSLPTSLAVYPGLCVTGRYVLSRDTELAKKLKELDATTATKELTGLEEDHPLFAAVAEKVKKVQGEKGESS